MAKVKTAKAIKRIMRFSHVKSFLEACIIVALTHIKCFRIVGRKKTKRPATDRRRRVITLRFIYLPTMFAEKPNAKPVIIVLHLCAGRAAILTGAPPVPSWPTHVAIRSCETCVIMPSGS